jgi:hypothetical protein
VKVKTLRDKVRYHIREGAKRMDQAAAALDRVLELSAGRPPQLAQWVATIVPALGICQDLFVQLERLYCGEESLPVPDVTAPTAPPQPPEEPTGHLVQRS